MVADVAGGEVDAVARGVPRLAVGGCLTGPPQIESSIPAVAPASSAEAAATAAVTRLRRSLTSPGREQRVELPPLAGGGASQRSFHRDSRGERQRLGPVV